MKQWLERILGSAPRVSKSSESYKAVYARVNARLKALGLCNTDLDAATIQSCVNVHSPTAPGVPDSTKGFTPEDFGPEYLPGYRVRHFSSMAHLGKSSADARGALRILERILRSVFPRSGSSFSLVLEKPKTV